MGGQCEHCRWQDGYRGQVWIAPWPVLDMPAGVSSKGLACFCLLDWRLTPLIWGQAGGSGIIQVGHDGGSSGGWSRGSQRTHERILFNEGWDEQTRRPSGTEALALAVRREGHWCGTVRGV